MVGAHRILYGSRDLTTLLLSGMVCHPRAGTCYGTVNLPAKFEVSVSTHYEDIKGDTKCWNWGGLGSLGVTQGH